MTAKYNGDAMTHSSTSAVLRVTVKGKASSTKVGANDRDFTHGDPADPHCLALAPRAQSAPSPSGTAPGCWAVPGWPEARPPCVPPPWQGAGTR